MKKVAFILFILFLFCPLTWAQTQTDFDVSIEEITIENMPPIHSFAWGQSNGVWLLIGGRINGLHGFMPNSSFPKSTQNTFLYVVNPQNNTVYSASVQTLPALIADQLASSNLEFYQDNGKLYVIGGYGVSSVTNSPITFPNICSIDVEAVIQSIMNNTDFSAYIKQINNENLAVTGGHLKKINNTYFLVAGHRFDGLYNHQGMPMYTQKYTNQIKQFTIEDSDNAFKINNYLATTDTLELHRRDYNLVPQIMPNYKMGLTAFSGVFRYQSNTPFLNCVNIDENGFYQPNTNFNQLLNHYHCATVPIFDSTFNAMHTLFFGGMAMYKYNTNNTLELDTLVPFVNTISKVTRTADGTTTETALPIKLPALLGTNAEFIPLLTVQNYENHVIKLNSLPSNQKTLIGYMVGGLESISPNVFPNNYEDSSPSSRIFKIFIEPKQATAVNVISNSPILKVVSNLPKSKELRFKIFNYATTNISANLLNMQGKVIAQFKDVAIKNNEARINLKNIPPGVYLLQIPTHKNVLVEKIYVH